MVPSVRHCSEERTNILSKGGCHGLLIISTNGVESMTGQSGPLLWIKTPCYQGHWNGTCLQSSVWKSTHWRATVAWSIPAKFLNITVVQLPSRAGTGYQTEREGSPCTPSQVLQHFLSHFQGPRGNKNPRCPTANAESPKDMTPTEETFDPGKEWNQAHEDVGRRRRPMDRHGDG